ncbi:MAG: hypothetical protein N2Z23_00025 [Pyrinomonadaceae bacterium]|nr:hypothetical protein [Pyrinomonadaceae bacterium]
MEQLSKKFTIRRIGSFLNHKAEFDIKGVGHDFQAHAYEVEGFVSKIANFTVLRGLLPLKIVVQKPNGENFFVFERPGNWVFRGEIFVKDPSGRLIAKLRDGFFKRIIRIETPLNQIKAIVKVESSGWNCFGKRKYRIVDAVERKQVGQFFWKGGVISQAHHCELEVDNDELLIITSLATAISICLYLIRK